MATTWSILIDWDRNNNFTGTHDNITARVVSANWFLGQRRAYQDVGDDSMLELMLDNTDRFYSPENTGSSLYSKLVPYRPVVIQSNDGSTTRTHWTGWVESIEPTVNQWGERRVKITAAGPMQFFKATETDIEVQENQHTDQIISRLLDEVMLPAPLNRSWLLGRAGYSGLGQHTYLGATRITSTLDTGNTTLTLAGDNWVRQEDLATGDKQPFNVYRAVADVTAAERGRFFFNRNGSAVFWNRHHLMTDPTPAATFNNSMQDLRYTYGNLDDFHNDIEVACRPRSLSESDVEVLWQLDQPITIRSGETRTVNVSYRDDSGNRIGGKNIKITDISYEQGKVGITVKEKANGAQLEMINLRKREAILNTCVIRGQKITDFGRMTAKSTDHASVVFYGKRKLSLNLMSVDNLDDAQGVADFEKVRRSSPRGTVKQMTVVSPGQKNEGHHNHQLDRTIGDIIRIQEQQTGHDRSYVIIGEAHRLSESGKKWETTWYLEPLTNNWFKLDHSTVGENDHPMTVGSMLAY